MVPQLAHSMDVCLPDEPGTLNRLGGTLAIAGLSQHAVRLSSESVFVVMVVGRVTPSGETLVSGWGR
ncbi:hypothetical protein C465_01809 [Halorubrum distributum JCM 9100]|uniref:ACT domain-containing protein n=1 Tax=Halorubrum distributum JCM 9100 TaxID=1227467 RepID=M0EXD0_9EURY|nr:hypothetical protein C465_01809 [Halorubrum distributum JCM 9100]